MKAITLRNIPPSLGRAIEKRAADERISLNRAVLQMLSEGLGIDMRERREVVHRDLDHLAGAWSAAEAAEFEATLSDQRRIDPELWT